MFICIYLKLLFLKGPPLLLVSFDPQFLISSDDQIMHPPPPPAQNEPGQAAREMQEIYCLINISPLPPQKRKGSLISDT